MTIKANDTLAAGGGTFQTRHRQIRSALRLTPIAIAAALLSSHALAAPRTWSGGAGLPFWDLTANWLTGSPLTGDSAVLGNADTTIRSGTWQLLSLSGTGLLTMTGGTLSINAASLIGSLKLSAGSIRDSGDLVIGGNGSVSFTGGQIGGDGGQVIANGGLSITGNANKTLGANGGGVSSGIVNNGLATWSGSGNLDNWSSGRFTNTASATLDIQTDASFLSGTFINQGALTKSVGTGGAAKTSITGSFSNSGSVNVQQGILSLINGGTHTGSFTTSGTGWVEFAGGNGGLTHNLNAGSSVTGNARFIDSFTPTVVGSSATYNTARTEIISGGQLQVTSGVTANTVTLGVSGGTYRGAGNLVASGLMSYTGGQIGGDGGQVIANGGLSITGNANKTLGANGGGVSSGIVNNGLATWSGSGNLDNWSSGRFTNTASATLDIQTDASFLSGTFINQGALTKSVGTGGAAKTSITGSFSNSGSVNVQQGILSLINGGTHTGSFTTSGTGWVEFAGGNGGLTHNLNAGSSVTGNARFIDSFTPTVVGSSATYNTARTEIISGGQLQVTSGVTANTVTLGVSGGTYRGAGNLVASGLMSYTGGQIGGDGGQVIANGGLSITGNANKTLGANGGGVSSGIVNNGLATWSGSGNLDNWSSGRFTNTASATLDIQTDASFLSGTFINQGALTKSVGTGGAAKTSITGSFSNSGSVNVQQGILSLINGGTHTGSFTTSGTGWVEFAGGNGGLTHNLNAGSSVTGNARFIDSFTPTVVGSSATYNTARTEIISGGQLQVTSGVTANTVTLGVSGGTYRGAGNLVASGLMSYTGGQIGGDGGQVIANGGLSITGNANKTLGANGGGVSSGIVNNGLATWSGSGNLDNWSSGRFTNTASATLDIQTDASFLSGTFINQGALTKSVGTGGAAKTSITGSFSNSGSVNVQQGVLQVTTPFNNQGVINTSVGTAFTVSDATFTNSGTIAGNGTVQTATNGALRNQGVISPGFSIGTLTLDGDLTMLAAGSLTFELSSTASFDKLIVTDAATFAGKLSVIDAGYVPVIGDTFKIITMNQRLAGSTFTNLSLSGFGNAVNFDVIYGTNDVTLRVAAVPEPAPWSLTLAGMLAVGAVVARRRQRA